MKVEIKFSGPDDLLKESLQEFVKGCLDEIANGEEFESDDNTYCVITDINIRENVLVVDFEQVESSDE